MPQYLVAIHHLDNYAPSTEDEAMMNDIHALNREMIAAGVRVFAGGLQPASNAKSLRAQSPVGRRFRCERSSSDRRPKQATKRHGRCAQIEAIRSNTRKD